MEYPLHIPVGICPLAHANQRPRTSQKRLRFVVSQINHTIEQRFRPLPVFLVAGQVSETKENLCVVAVAFLNLRELSLPVEDWLTNVRLQALGR